MRIDRLRRLLTRGALGLLGLAAAAGAPAQTLPYAGLDTPPAAPSSGVSYTPPANDGAGDAAPRRGAQRPHRARTHIGAYLEIDQGLSADLNGGDTLTYTSVSVGVDGRVETRRVAVQVSYRYDRLIDWNGRAGDRDIHSGLALLHADISPGLLNFDAGALATRTGGQGRVFGLTGRDSAIDVYGVYAGPTLATHAGDVAVNAAYRLGYAAIDDHTDRLGLFEDFGHSISHNLSGSVGMGPGRLPFGWTLGGGYLRSSTGGPFQDRFHAAFVRGDVVLPVSPTLALTAGIGYEDIQSSQNDILRDSGGVPILGSDGRTSADPTHRILTYDIDGLIYDGGLIWRPSAHTELQVRAGHRYGGTTVVGSFTHRFNSNYGMNVQVFDTIETFGSLLINDLSGLPNDFEPARNPLTGDLTGCVFGTTPGSGGCLDRSVQSIRGGTFRLRGASAVVSGSRGLWDLGIGASYIRRDFAHGGRSDLVAVLGGDRDESATLYASVGRRLSRVSEINFDAYASWYDSDAPGFASVTGFGGTASYTRRLFIDRLRFLAALGLYHTTSAGQGSTIASGLVGLRYDF